MAVVVAPHHIGQHTFGDELFNIVAIQAEVALYIKAIATAGDRALSIDRAGTGRLVKQRADHRA
jgi:hypothetical protein